MIFTYKNKTIEQINDDENFIYKCDSKLFYSQFDLEVYLDFENAFGHLINSMIKKGLSKKQAINKIKKLLNDSRYSNY